MWDHSPRIKTSCYNQKVYCISNSPKDLFGEESYWLVASVNYCNAKVWVRTTQTMLLKMWSNVLLAVTIAAGWFVMVSGNCHCCSRRGRENRACTRCYTAMLLPMYAFMYRKAVKLSCTQISIAKKVSGEREKNVFFSLHWLFSLGRTAC